MGGQMTLDALVLAARQRASMETSQFVSDAEVQSYVNQSAYELYDLLVAAYADDYFLAPPFTFVTDGVNDTFPLPADFFKLVGADVSISNGTPGTWVTLRPFEMAERNLYALPGVTPFLGIGAMRYRLRALSIWFLPLPAAGQTMRLLYVPRMVEMADSATLSLAGVVAGDSVTVGATVFAAVSSSPTGTQFLVGASDSVTATNLAAAITAAGLGVTAAASGTVVTLTVGTAPVSLALSASSGHITASLATLTNFFDGISGWTEYVIVDAAAKCGQKEESDVSVLLAQKVALKARIETMRQNRDVGMPHKVSRVRSNPWGNDYPYGRGGGPWGL